MVQGWGPTPLVPRPPLANQQERQERRRRLEEQLAGVLLLIPNGAERVRANDTAFRFRPSSNFIYLVGEGEQGDVLALVPTASAGHEARLYTTPPSPWTAPNVIADRVQGALWAMPRLSMSETADRYGLATEPLSDLPALLARYRDTAVLRGIDSMVDDLVPPRPELDGALAAHLAEMRLFKSPWEINELAKACQLTAEAFQQVVGALSELRTERQVEAIFDGYARTVGAGTGYLSIVAAGTNATVRHNSRNQGGLNPGELLLIDAGVETDEYYTADVTRTIPIRGEFSPWQREVYQVVWRAHQAALAATRPGVAFRQPHDAAMRALCEGLHDMGILKVGVDEAVQPDRQLYRRYCRHGTSHMLGIDVHDCVDAPVGQYLDGHLQPGMVLTIEPGLYLQPHDLTVPEDLRGIGIRIEDDILVTPEGMRNLSEGIPAASEDVESWVRPDRGPAPSR